MICWTYRKGLLVKRSIGTEGENAHEKPEILEITGFHDYSHRHFLSPVRLHKAEIGTDDKSLGFPPITSVIGAYDKYLGIALLHSRLAIQ